MSLRSTREAGRMTLGLALGITGHWLTLAARYLLRSKDKPHRG